MMIDDAYSQAKLVVRQCSTKRGLFASGGTDGYDAIWARDSMITCIGASLSNDKKIKEVFKQSIITLSRNQSRLGQIPNCVDRFSKRKPHVDFASIDSSLWYIIGQFAYFKRYKDRSLIRKYESNIEDAALWLGYQDFGEEGTLMQLPTTDWQDAFPHKYGRTINTQALYYKVLTLLGERKKSTKLRFIVDKHSDRKLWNGEFYDAWRWKNHRKYSEKGEWFDTLGNLLAIVYELADKKKSNSILDYIKKKKIAEPYPAKAISPPIKRDSKDWKDYFADCDAGKPDSYLNGGIWPFIGGFYVLALVKMKKFKEAEKELQKLAELNIKGKFPEWMHPKTKKSFGKLQAWDAGMYIAAYESVKRKRVLV